MKLMDQLIRQSKSPDGIVGRIMIRIMNLAHNSRTKWALNKLDICEDSVVLDVGCGGGNTISLLTQRVIKGKVCGIDYSKESVEVTKKKNKKAIKKGLVEIVQASVLDIPYSKESFDFVTAIQTHYHLEDLKNSFIEINRVLRTQGEFLILSESYKIRYHMSKYKLKSELSNLYKDTGFKNIKILEENGWMCVVGTKG